MNYIQHYDFALDENFKIKEITINGSIIYVFENVFKYCNKIHELVKNSNFYIQPVNEFLRLPYFQTDFRMKELEFLIREVIEFKEPVCLNGYVVDEKIQERIARKSPTYSLENTYRGTLFLHNTNGINVYKNKYTNSIFYSKEYRRNYDIAPVFLDDLFWSQWEKVIHLKGNQNTLYIYPMKLFAFIDFTEKMENNRYTMEFVFS